MHRTCVALFATVLLAAPVVRGAEPTPIASRPEHDPIEPVNRGIFRFNDAVDTWVLEPVATGWHWVMPDPVEKAVSRFFDNLRFPIVLVNDVLQGKVVAGASDVGRFAVNTTAGVAGFFDPATHLGLDRHDEDFGQTLGAWGLPPGPYLVLPFLGPSTIRDTGGLAVDAATYVPVWFVEWYVTTGSRLVEAVNTRAHYLDEVRKNKEAALDYYEFVRDAYLQHRRALVNDSEDVPAEEQQDIYELEPTKR
ncbi:MAG: VacJ family lipoprotein [Candidatus Binatia bacterium]